jgi:glutaredoxin
MAIEIYSKPSCSFCEQAKNLLRSKGHVYIEYKLDEDFTKEILLSKFPEAKTFPVIVVDGYNIGGYHQLIEHLNTNTGNAKLLVENNYYGA